MVLKKTLGKSFNGGAEGAFTPIEMKRPSDDKSLNAVTVPQLA